LLTAAVVAVAAGVAGCFTTPWLVIAVGHLRAFAAMVAMRVRAARKRLTTPVAESMA
jgi:hypothetical protein